MTTACFTSREFNHDLARAKRAASQGPVIVTDRGAPAYVLLSHKDYCRLSGVAGASIVDLLRQPEGEDIDFDPPRLDNITRPADL